MQDMTETPDDLGVTPATTSLGEDEAHILWERHGSRLDMVVDLTWKAKPIEGLKVVPIWPEGEKPWDEKANYQ